MAAGRTVEHGRVHSLHSYFLRPGDPPRAHPLRGRPHPRRPVVHHPPGGGHPARAGHLQHGGVVPRRRGGLDHQFPMPEVPAPETLPTLLERLEPLRDELADWFARPIPSTSATSASCRGSAREPGEPVQRLWIRADGDLPDDPLLHAVHRHLRVGHVAVRHHARPPTRSAGTTPTSWGPASTTACGSTGPFRADDWLLYDMDCPMASGARGLARGFLSTGGTPGACRWSRRADAPGPRPGRSDWPLHVGLAPVDGRRSRGARPRCRAGGAGRSSSPGRASPASAPASRRSGGWRRARGTSRAGNPWPGRSGPSRSRRSGRGAAR